MRRAMIAAALALLPLSAHAQSRPAPDTPGPPDIVEDAVRAAPPNFTDALRVLVVTSGIIGGFIAADIASGGALTAPLLTGGTLASASAGGARLLARAAPIRPIIVRTAVPSAVAGGTAATLGDFSRLLARALAAGKSVL
ncbi:MAG: hypothetical protein WCO00_17995 [Rhodospirillaceae bacterium]